MSKIVLTGSAGHITKPLALQLLKAGHDVTVIGRSAENLESVTDAGAKAAIGSVDDADFLKATFTGADAVYTMVPPNFATNQWIEYIAGVGENYATAIQAAGVRKVVNLSSVGAHMPEGAGPVSGLHRVEAALNKLEGVDVLHLRPAFFMYNFMSMAGMAKGMNLIGGNYGDSLIQVVHTEDIAAAACEALNTLSFTGKSVSYIVGDEVDGKTVAQTLGKAIGNENLPWIVFSDEQNLQGAIGAGVPEHHAALYTEMGAALRSGEMASHFRSNDNGQRAPRKLADFAQEWAAVYNAN